MDRLFQEHQGQNVGDMERKISAIAGGVLVATTLFRRTPLSIPLLIGGGYLLYRGLSGNDVFYRALKINRVSGESSNPIHVRHSEVIDRPVEEVYRYWRNLENLPYHHFTTYPFQFAFTLSAHHTKTIIPSS